MKAWPVLGLFIIQVILFCAHWFIFLTWMAFWPGLAPAAVAGLRAAMLVLAFSFVVASLLSFRFSNFAVRTLYRLAAAWLGFLNFFFWASLLLWLAWFALRLSHLSADAAAIRPLLADAFYFSAGLISVYGLINARILRVRRYRVALPNLPASWRGRRAVLISDLHLGPVNGAGFCTKMVNRAESLRPDIVFIAGDLFDGTRGDLDQMAGPLKQLAAPFGLYFSTGNHEEFSDPAQYIEAVKRTGVRVLANEMVTVDGLQIAGVLYHDSSSPLRMKAALDSMHLDRAHASILLNHAPTRLPLVEQAGFTLQLSGHTHGGQISPFTWLTERIYGRFTRGLHRFGALQVYTSTGCGTWGPPLRVGTRPEMVLMEFS